MAIKLPGLPYGYEALEPVISSATLKLHHGTHHRGYVDKVNALVTVSSTLEDIVRYSKRRAATDPGAGVLFNNAAQAWNHDFFWKSLRPKGGGSGPSGPLAERIEAEFGSQEKLLEQLKAAALAVFGSGWTWLVLDGGALSVVSTRNADTPDTDMQKPLLVLDVWEHAYYLDYQSRRAEYVSGVVEHLLDWQFAERNFLQQEAAHV
jgi:Fe-Mn family superoxide dismutase